MSVSDHDRERLRRAVALAAKGRFAVEPNPIVGCVIERQGRVVGEGWHVAYGGPHAEVEALAKAGVAAEGATAYVSLEPCTKVGKTGACATALRQAGIARIVYASKDPNMDDDGLALLRAAGVEVEGPVLEAEGAPLLEPFLRARDRDRPWVILKWAMSLDGRIAPAAGKGGPISGERARAFVHDARAHVDAVAVGIDTVLADDPRLTCRLEGGPPHDRPQPARVVFDTRLRTPATARLLQDAPDVPLYVVCAEAPPDRRMALESRGAKVARVGSAEGRVDLAAALRWLREQDVHRVLVEGGANVHGALLRAGLADQVTAIVAPIVLGGHGAPAAVTGTGIADVAQALRLEETQWRRLGDDLLQQGYLPTP
jgi:diaminohydroxyphosphoribosylaminopyrimidine deaminase/5-amino-6-(5-phosphoribosylamino)uracil reductase